MPIRVRLVKGWSMVELRSMPRPPAKPPRPGESIGGSPTIRDGAATEIASSGQPTVLASPSGTSEHTTTLAAPRGPRSAPLTHLGRYVVTSRLGAGGMGEVLAVKDESLDREVAAKVAREGADDLVVAKLVAEARLTGQLEHPAIVPVHEAGRTADGRCFFTMKRIHGRDLEAVLSEPPPLVERLHVFLKICEAISFAHSRGVIHRDLKPANVMVGEFGEVLVCDWGIAKRLGSHVEAGRQTIVADPLATLDGQIMGTPAYMPPEQADGRIGDIDERSDVYALGAILYQLLALEPPYRGRTSTDVLRDVQEGRLVPPSHRQRDVPLELEAVVMKAMARTPSDRYASAEALRADVERFLTGRALAAASYTPIQLAWKWARRNRAICAAIAIGALGVGGLVAQQLAAQARELELTRAQAALAGQNAQLAEQFRLERDAADAATRRELVAKREQAELAARNAELAEQYRIQRDVERFTHRIAESRGLFYAHGVDVTLALRGLRAAVDELGQLMRDPGARTHAPGWTLLGVGRFLAGDIQGAIEALSTAHDLEPTDASARVHLARVLLERALSVLIQANVQDVLPERSIARLAAADVDRAHTLLEGAVVPSEIELAVAAVLLAWAEGRYDQAAELCERHLGSLRLQPGSEDLFLVRALCAARQGLPDADVHQILRLALRWRTNHAWSLLVETWFLRGEGDPKGALAQLDRLVAMYPTFLAAYVNRSVLRADASDFAGAMSDAQRAVELQPTWVIGYLRLASTSTLMGDLKGAAEHLERAIQADPSDARSYIERGNLRIRTGELDLARADYDRAIAIDDRSPEAHYNRGVLLRRQKRWAEAVADYDRAIALRPRFPSALINRGVLRRAGGDPEGAVGDYRAALAVDPREWSGWANLGFALVDLGRRDEAAQARDEALRRAPADQRETVRQRFEAAGVK